MTEIVSADNFIPRDDMSPQELESLWQEWSVIEQDKRLILPT
jgi:hypothetical protein